MSQQFSPVALASMQDSRANNIDAIYTMASGDRTPTAPRNSVTASSIDSDGMLSGLSPDHTLVRTPTFNSASSGLLLSSYEGQPQFAKPFLRPRAWSDATTATCYSNNGLQPRVDLDVSPSLPIPCPQHSIYSINASSNTTVVLRNSSQLEGNHSYNPANSPPSTTHSNGKTSALKQFIFGTKQPKQLRAIASDADIKKSVDLSFATYTLSNENLNPINEDNVNENKNGNVSASNDKSKGKASSTRSRKKKVPEPTMLLDSFTLGGQLSVGILPEFLPVTSPTSRKAGKKTKNGKSSSGNQSSNGVADQNTKKKNKGSPAHQVDTKLSSPTDTADVNVGSPVSLQYSLLEEDSDNRRASRVSTLAKNRRAYITKSIVSAESLMRRTSTLSLASSATKFKEEDLLPMPGNSVSLLKASTASHISAPEERPISTISSSFLDYEIEHMPAPAVSVNDSESMSSVSVRSPVEELDTPSVALKEDYRAFIEAIGNFRDSWLSDDEEELERQEKERCANLLTLLRSEQKFVRMLRLLKNQFIVPLQQAAKKPGIYVGRSFSEKDVSSVFGLVEQLLPLHEDLLHDLEQSAENHGHSGTIEDAINTFSKHFRGLYFHFDYLRDYPNILCTLDQLQKRNQHFRRVLKECESSTDHFNIRAFLANPKDCIIRYHNFLQKMVSLYQPYDPEYLLIIRCSVKIKCLHDEYMQLLRTIQRQEDLAQLQCLIVGNDFNLLAADRQLLYQGVMQYSSTSFGKFESRTCFLFNDLLVVTKEMPDGKYEYKGRINLVDAHIESTQNDIKVTTASGKEHTFKVEVANFHWQWVRHLTSRRNS